jgi:hypothetical protein
VIYNNRYIERNGERIFHLHPGAEIQTNCEFLDLSKVSVDCRPLLFGLIVPAVAPERLETRAQLLKYLVLNIDVVSHKAVQFDPRSLRMIPAL